MTCHSDRKPMCQYCGQWNGHPDGVVMEVKLEDWFDYRCVCPVCKATGPKASTPEDAIDDALRRFQPIQKPMTLEEIVELQKAYKTLFDSKRLTKKAMCDLVVPFRDKYSLSDSTALRVARGELSLEQIAKLIASCGLTDEERAAAKWDEQ